MAQVNSDKTWVCWWTFSTSEAIYYRNVIVRAIHTFPPFLFDRTLFRTKYADYYHLNEHWYVAAFQPSVFKNLCWLVGPFASGTYYTLTLSLTGPIWNCTHHSSVFLISKNCCLTARLESTYHRHSRTNAITVKSDIHSSHFQTSSFERRIIWNWYIWYSILV